MILSNLFSKNSYNWNTSEKLIEHGHVRKKFINYPKIKLPHDLPIGLTIPLENINKAVQN